MTVKVGQPAPDFTLPSEQGEITLSRYQGKTHVLLAFYPGDFTPVCTSEMACFREDWSKFRETGTEILGISPDPLDKHGEFARKLKLEFPLLSDSQQTVSKLYGVSSLLGTARAYFIVDRQGIVQYKHVELLPLFKRENSELLAVLKRLR